MTDILKVRDHSQPCGHAPDNWKSFGALAREGWLIGHHAALGNWCPGGKEIRLEKRWTGRMENIAVWLEVDND